MNNKPKVSIVVPIYNKEKILYKCLDSLVNQTMQDIEIILINDGSTDNSEAVCLDYVNKYPNLVQYHAFENGGVSRARNRGIDLAVGEYIGFVDSDDWVSIGLIEKTRPYFGDDIIIYDLLLIDKHQSQLVTGHSNNIDSFANTNPVWRNAVWNKLFRKSLVDKYNLRFIENCHHSEDLAFVFCCLSIATSIKCINKCLYTYNINESSVTQQSYIRDSLIDEIYSVIDYTYKFIIDKKDYGKLKEIHYTLFIEQVLMRSLLPVLRNYLLDHADEFILQHKKFMNKLTHYSFINNLSVPAVTRVKIYTILYIFSHFPKTVIQIKKLLRLFRNKC